MSKLEKSAKVQGVASLQDALNKRKIAKGSIPTLNEGTIKITLLGFYQKKIYGDANGATLQTLKGELLEAVTVKAYDPNFKTNIDTNMAAKAMVSFSLEQCANCSELVWEDNGLNWVDKGTWEFTVLDGKITNAKEVGATKSKADLQKELDVLEALPAEQRKAEPIKSQIADLEAKIAAK